MNAVKSRRIKVLAATVGLWMAHSLPGYAAPQQPGAEAASLPAAKQPAEPSRLTLVPEQPLKQASPQPANQQLANILAEELRMSGHLKGYTIDIRVENGLVELTGQVASQAQREEAVRIVQGVPGIERVRDNLTVTAPVTPVNVTVQPTPTEPRNLQHGPADGSTGPSLGGAAAPEPLSIFQGAGPPGPAGLGGAGIGHMPPPPMPPYAWPTYAPYNNVSRVGYPSLYPYQSWPFIGPMYPFPKVPLGWRSVQLKWQDGHWWYGRTATGHDWWRVRYW
jgi:hypothetical protein